jgi:D-alanyl-D-alanine carboxypeptidase
MTTSEIIKKYGKPTQNGSPYLTTIKLPYPMRLSWDKKISVNKMSCHKLLVNNFTNVFNELLAHYGLAELQRLEIDIFGGCFNFRAMRGGSDFSTHSWAIAIDLSPEKNTLKMTFAQSQFSKPEYAKMHEIFERNGFENYGKVRNFDSMHFCIKQ